MSFFPTSLIDQIFSFIHEIEIAPERSVNQSLPQWGERRCTHPAEMSSRLEQSLIQGTFARGADRGNWACLGKRAPGNAALAKREGWVCAGRARMDLITRDFQRRCWESCKNSKGVSRSPGLERHSPQGWSFLGAVWIHFWVFFYVYVSERSDARHNPEIVMTEDLQNKRLLDREMSDGNFRAHFLSSLWFCSGNISFPNWPSCH